MKLTRRQAIGGAAVLGLLAAASGGAALSCRVEGTPLVDRHKILTDVARVVIVPTYEEASTSAATLSTAMDRLAQQPDATSLAAAQEAWRKSHAVWKRADAFLFGPADDLAVTAGAIDSGPPDDTKLSAVVAGTATIDAAFVASLGGNQRGFAGLEWLLFEPIGGDAALLAALTGPLGERRRTLGSLIAKDLQVKIDAVRDGWLPGKGDYATALAEAGRSSTIYSSERQGVDAIVNALIAAAEVLTAVRLAKPLGLDRTPQEPHPELVESPRAGTSIEDILAVLDGIESVYTCSLGGVRGLPLGDAVRDYGPRADDAFRADLVRAREAVRAIPPPLGSAVSAQRDAVLAAHAAVREVKRRLSTEIASALGTSVGFNVTDGD